MTQVVPVIPGGRTVTQVVPVGLGGGTVRTQKMNCRVKCRVEQLPFGQLGTRVHIS